MRLSRRIPCGIAWPNSWRTARSENGTQRIYRFPALVNRPVPGRNRMARRLRPDPELPRITPPPRHPRIAQETSETAENPGCRVVWGLRAGDRICAPWWPDSPDYARSRPP